VGGGERLEKNGWMVTDKRATQKHNSKADPQKKKQTNPRRAMDDSHLCLSYPQNVLLARTKRF
jgi:hypothetical protein